ncbi:hypothetical protein [Streptomyces sp. NPDC093109]|uniref:hypothetical protein n=1 Tax=Streptomyces sp. NPDC093109 TaxID=3154977 RepID=UPI00344BB62E
MTAVAHEELDEFLWQRWKAMDPPEGCRAEIIEGPSKCHSPAVFVMGCSATVSAGSWTPI